MQLQTMLTVYGIETNINSLTSFRKNLVATVLTVYGIETGLMAKVNNGPESCGK